MKLFEKLGVPEEFIEQVSEIYDEFLRDLSQISQREINKNIFSEELIIGKYNINLKNKTYTIPILFNFIEVEEEMLREGKPVLVSAGKGSRTIPKFGDDNKIKMKSEPSDSIILIRVAFSNVPTSQDLIEIVKQDFTSDILAHELKHLFDAESRGEYNLEEIAFYNSVQINKFPEFIQELFFLLYYTTHIENSVRPSEMYQKMKEEKISKKEFKDFFENHKVIKYLKKAKNFSLEDFIEKLKNDETMNQVINEEDYQREFDEPYKDMLKVILINLNQRYIEEFEKITPKLLIDLAVFTGDYSKEESLTKYLDEVLNKKNKEIRKPLNYFVKLEKLLNFVGDKMIKKLSKLYDMAQDQEDNEIFDWDLHTKINTKNENIVTKFKDFITFSNNKQNQ